MSKEKLIVEKSYDGEGNLYFTVHEEDNMDIIGSGYSKKNAIEDYKENLKIYEKLNKNK